MQQFVALDVNKMRQTMGVSGEDHSFGDFLPVAARFEPEAAVEKDSKHTGRPAHKNWFSFATGDFELRGLPPLGRC